MSSYNTLPAQPPETFKELVSLGQIPGWQSTQIIGRSTQIGSDFSVVWAQGGEYTFETAASTWYLSSSAAADTSLTILCFCLDTNFDQVVVAVSTDAVDGRTPVALGTQVVAVNVMVNNSATGNTNQGDLYLSTDAGDIVNGVPQTQSKIKDKMRAGGTTTLEGKNVSETAIFTVPRGMTLLIEDIKVAVGKGEDASLKNIRQAQGKVPVQSAEFPVFQGFQNLPFFAIGGSPTLEKTNLYQVANTTNPGTVSITSGFDVILAPYT